MTLIQDYTINWYQKERDQKIFLIIFVPNIKQEKKNIFMRKYNNSFSFWKKNYLYLSTDNYSIVYSNLFFEFRILPIGFLINMKKVILLAKLQHWFIFCNQSVILCLFFIYFISDLMFNLINKIYLTYYFFLYNCFYNIKNNVKN